MAVLTPILGNVSETFVRRHVEEVGPKPGAAIALRESPNAVWKSPEHTFLIEPTESMPKRAAMRGFRLAFPNHFYDRLDAWLQARSAPVVMGEYLDFSLPFLEELSRRGYRTVAHAHGYDVSQHLREDRWREEYLRYEDFVDAIVTVSQLTKDRLIDLGIRRPIHVVPCGVEPPNSVPPLPEPPLKLIFVGRFTPKKGPEQVVEAFAKSRLAETGAELTMIGEGSLKAQVEDAVSRHRLGDAIHLLGAQPHARVLEELSCAHAFVQHNRVDPYTGDEEGLPVAILEAMAHERVVVSTFHAGIPEAVVHGESGLLVEEGDVQGMADNLRSLHENPSDIERLGRAARRRVQEGFSAEHEIRKLRPILGMESAS